MSLTVPPAESASSYRGHLGAILLLTVLSVGGTAGMRPLVDTIGRTFDQVVVDTGLFPDRDGTGSDSQ